MRPLRGIRTAAVALLALGLGCGSGAVTGDADSAFVQLGVAPFTKVDTLPDVPNIFGIQSIVYPSPFGTTYADPELVAADVGFRLYYTEGGDTIELATSTDSRTWTRVGVVLEATEPWEAGRVSAPTVVRDGAEHLLLYEGGSRAGIGLARSADGVTFVKDPANPVLVPGAPWEMGNVGAPTVRVGPSGDLEMLSDGASRRGIGAASSPDGVTWTRTDGDASTAAIDPVLAPEVGGFDADRASDPSLLVEDVGNGRPALRVWYTGSASGNDSIGAAGSFGGAAYQRFSGNPVMEETLTGGAKVDEAEASVLRLETGVALMAYNAVVGLDQGIGLAELEP